MIPKLPAPSQKIKCDVCGAYVEIDEGGFHGITIDPETGKATRYIFIGDECADKVALVKAQHAQQEGVNMANETVTQVTTNETATTQKPSTTMKNVTYEVDGTMLYLSIDLSQEQGPSSSGKSLIIASSGGNVQLPGTDVYLGLNVYRKTKP